MGTGRKKISIRKVENIKHRRVTFTKRRQGLFKKADQLSGLIGCRVAALVYSPAMKPFMSLLEEAAAIGRTFGNPNALSDIASVMDDDEFVMGEELVMAGLYDDDDDACSNVNIDPAMQQYYNNNYASSNTTKNNNHE